MKKMRVVKNLVEGNYMVSIARYTSTYFFDTYKEAQSFAKKVNYLIDLGIFDYYKGFIVFK